MLPAGTVIAGRYRILGALGQGGMGTVYRAVHLSLGRAVALKLLDRKGGSPDHGVRFDREAHAAAALDHPGCVRVLDYGRHVDGSRYLAMELCEGPTLAEVAARAGRLGTAAAVAAVSQLLDALAHAHAHGLVHRDVKPGNAMYATREAGARLVLIDFGLARLVDDAPLTARGVCLGSVSYIAPERLLRQPCDGRADLYSVGVVLYELLTGVRPFEGKPLAVAQAHLDAHPRPLRAIRPDVPAAVAAVVVHAMAKHPARRFASAAAMRDALLDALVPQPVATVMPGEGSTRIVPRELAPWPRRAWAWLWHGAWRWRVLQ